jgi:hypothetical protein
VVNFSKMTDRLKHPLSIPRVDVHESRFESVNSNIELITKYRKTNSTLDLGLLKARSELYTPQPTTDYSPKLIMPHLAEIKMSKQLGHETRS